MSDRQTYRDALEYDFGSYVGRLNSINFDSGSNTTLEQFKNVLAVQFALNCANDIVRKYRYDMHYIDQSSTRWNAYVAAEPRMDNAFREILSSKSHDYEDFKELVFRALDRLVDPSEEEVHLAGQYGDSTMTELTDDFLSIRDFLYNQVIRHS